MLNTYQWRKKGNYNADEYAQDKSARNSRVQTFLMLWEENSEGKLYLFVPSFKSNQWSSYRVSMTVATLPIGKTSLTGIESFTEINNLLQNWNCFLDALFSQMHNFLLRYIQSEARGKMKGTTAHLIRISGQDTWFIKKAAVVRSQMIGQLL